MFLGVNDCYFIYLDRDLVINDIDLDDDNDGILDTDTDDEIPGHSDVNGKAISSPDVNILTGGVEKDYRIVL